MTDKPSQDTPAEADLDALLDEALNDFEESDQSKPGPSQASSSTHTAQHKDKPLGLGKGLGKGLTTKSKAKKPQAPAPAPFSFPGFGRGFGAVPPDIGDQDELSANFQKMMAELAHVDLSQDDVRLPNVEPPVPGNHDLAATLNALNQAANSGSFGAGPSGAGQPGQLSPDILNDELFNRMSQQLDALGRDAAGSNQQPGAEDMTGLVDGIMQQLLAKDVLYQPIQDIGARYPQWLADHRDGMNDKDYQRYSQQYQHIQEITKLYEEEPNNYTKLVDLLQQMQSCGQPPQEIVDEMAPGLGSGLGSLDSQGALGGLGSLGLPGMPKGDGACCIQ